MSKADNIQQQIKQLLLDNIQNISAKDLSLDAELFALGLNSLNAVSIVLGLEETFDFEFDMDEIDYQHFQTIGSMIELVKSKT
ncbi:MAG: phosphopantetheine-binding protein [Cyanobacteria bacterium J06621_12]